MSKSTNKNAIEHQSDSSSDFEAFLKNMKSTNKPKKYRLSTGSLSNFIVEKSSFSSEDTLEPQKPKPLQNCNKLLSLTEIPVKRTKKHVWRKHRTKKSVATPKLSIVFSSDSEDDKIVSPFKSPNLLGRRPSFTDSDKENQTGLHFSGPKVLDFSSSTDESDDDDIVISRDSSITSAVSNLMSTTFLANDNTKKVKSITFSDSGDDGKFVSLRDRLLSNPQQKTTKNFEDSHLKTRTKSNVNGLLTPQNKQVQKHFQTEKPNRPIKKLCTVANCFLGNLDLFVPQNSGALFKKSKAELTTRLFNFFNLTIFENQLPESLHVSWAKRLSKTAGVTKCRRITKSYKDDHDNIITSQSYEASISLSEKVLDCAHRLRDTLIHEMCHAAVWIVNHVNEGHGPFWKSWAAKARRVHPELPMIDRCHNYDIEYKYRYKCTRCSSTIGRHSKSIDTTTKACGKCFGKLILLNKSKGGNPFSNFVKDHYKSTKDKLEDSSCSVSHRDVMKSLSDQFKAVNLASNPKS